MIKRGIENVSEGGECKRLKNLNSNASDCESKSGNSGPIGRKGEEARLDHSPPLSPSPSETTPARQDSKASHTATHETAANASASRQISLEKAFVAFPEKLMNILDDPELQDSIFWNEKGDNFCVVPQKFIGKVLKYHFQGSKFESFTRKLNRWGFKRVLDAFFAPGAVVYHHDLFQKNKPELMKELKGATSKKNKKMPPQASQPLAKGDEVSRLSRAGQPAMNVGVPGSSVASLSPGLLSPASALAAEKSLALRALANGGIYPPATGLDTLQLIVSTQSFGQQVAIAEELRRLQNHQDYIAQQTQGLGIATASLLPLSASLQPQLLGSGALLDHQQPLQLKQLLLLQLRQQQMAQAQSAFPPL